MFQIETISAKMLDYFVGRTDAVIIDLRDRDAYLRSHVRGAENYPYAEIEGSIEFPRNKTLVFYCDRGGASMKAARQFARRGYQTRSVIGGFEAYRGRNLVISGKAW
ncbi:MAG: rhodanese-like domain-containing protein [Eubacteriales bacterium]|nr:rhodanese-like domain-containing protein [Eubacteriales bacterium]